MCLTWAPTDNKHLLWMNDKETFRAYYPVDENGILIDEIYYGQSTLEKITMSDLMQVSIFDVRKGNVVIFKMGRNTMRIIIRIMKFNLEFSADNKVRDVKILSHNYQVLNPYQQGDEGINSPYTLLSQGCVYANYANYVTLKVGEKEMHSANLQNNMEYGKSYTFNPIEDKEKSAQADKK